MKFSRMFLPFCTLATLAGCAYVIPPTENAPRNNTVVGEPHRPQLNNGSMGSGQPQSSVVPQRAPVQPVAVNDVPALPPVDAATKAQAEQEMAQAPVVPVAAPAAGSRRVPAENAPFVVSANDSYPSLMNVPERPPLSGPDSSKARLTDVQTNLVKDRANAEATKDALARDAAAEPSMLAPMPQAGAVVPPNDPISAQPAPASVTIPSRDTVRNPVAKPSVSAAPVAPAPVAEAAPRIVMPAPAGSLNVPTFAPPAPMNMASTPAPRAASPAPIVLMRPVENPSTGIAAQDLPAPNAAPISMASSSRPNVKKGDFDPLAAADNAPIASAPAAVAKGSAPTTYASDGYLANSRYAAARRY